MSLSKTIDVNILEYYDGKKRVREDAKIDGVPIKNKNDIVSEFFRRNRDGKIYGVKFAYNTSNVIQPQGTKYAANASLNITASTRTVAGVDDYSNLALFKHLEANIHQDTNGDLVIDHLLGEPGFSYTGKVNVVCLFAPVYEKVYTGTEGTTNYLYIEWCDSPRDGFTLNPLCKDSEGNNRGFFAIAKFQAGLIDGVLYSSAGLYPWNSGQISSGATMPCYINAVAKYHEISTHQCPMVMAQYCYLQKLYLMKYAHTNYQSKLGGISNYAYSRGIYSTVTDKNYLLVQSPGDLYVGTFWDLHAGASRQTEFIDTLEIISKDTTYGTWPNINNSISISDSSYTITSPTFMLTCKSVDGQVVDPSGEPIQIDFAQNGEPVEVTFEYTSARKLNVYHNGTQIATTTSTATTSYSVIYVSKNVTTTNTMYIHTSLYSSGYSLGILGNDGCFMPGTFSQTPRFPSVLSGVEILTGCANLIGNAIIEYDSNHNGNILVCNDPTKVSSATTDITTNYENAGHFTPTTTGSNLKGLINIDYNLEKGTYGGTCGTGGSTTTGLCDSLYWTYTTSGRYQIYAFGHCSNGDHVGLFFLNVNDAITKTSSVSYLATRPAFVTKF